MPGQGRLRQSAFAGFDVRLQVVGQRHVFDQALLGFQPVDGFFAAFEQVFQQFAADVVLLRFAQGDGFDQQRALDFALVFEVALQAFFDVLADQEFAEVLQVGQAFEEKDAFDQLIGFLHHADGLLVLVIVELFQAPVAEHAGVQKILVDRGEFVLEHLVQGFDDFLVAFHHSPLKPLRCPSGFADNFPDR